MCRWHMYCIKNKLFMKKYNSFFVKLIEQNVILDHNLSVINAWENWKPFFTFSKFILIHN